MHNAPPVVYSVGRCAFHGWLLVAIGGASGAVAVLFLAASDFRNFGAWSWLCTVACMAIWLLWSSWALLGWMRSPEGSLRWEPRRSEEDGAHGAWSWTGRGCPEPLTLSGVERVIDLQGRVLLRFSGRGVRHSWVWVERSKAPVRWHDLRRALISSCA